MFSDCVSVLSFCDTFFLLYKGVSMVLLFMRTQSYPDGCFREIPEPLLLLFLYYKTYILRYFWVQIYKYYAKYANISLKILLFQLFFVTLPLNLKVIYVFYGLEYRIARN